MLQTTRRTIVRPAVLAMFFSCAFAGGALAQGAVDSPIGKPSELVGTALNGVAKAGSGVDLNRWKGGNVVKQDVDDNLASIQKDLQATLPPLLQAADDAPLSVSASLPVLLNMDALYSVLLRISISGKVDAPHDQSIAIDGALMALDGARRDLGERIVKLAASQDKQMATLMVTLKQQGALLQQAQAVQQPANAAPAPKTPAKKKRVPAAKPAPAN